MLASCRYFIVLTVVCHFSRLEFFFSSSAYFTVFVCWFFPKNRRNGLPKEEKESFFPSQAKKGRKKMEQ